MSRVSPIVLTGSVAGGAVFAVLTIFAVISGYEYYGMGLLLLGVLILVTRSAGHAPFLNGFAGGFAAILSAIWGQALFLPTYFQNNPDYAHIEIPWGLSARLYTFLSAPVGAVFAGIALAVLAVALSWIARKTAHHSNG